MNHIMVTGLLEYYHDKNWELIRITIKYCTTLDLPLKTGHWDNKDGGGGRRQVPIWFGSKLELFQSHFLYHTQTS